LKRTETKLERTLREIQYRFRTVAESCALLINTGLYAHTCQNSRQIYATGTSSEVVFSNLDVELYQQSAIVSVDKLFLATT